LKLIEMQVINSTNLESSIDNQRGFRETLDVSNITDTVVLPTLCYTEFEPQNTENECLKSGLEKSKELEVSFFAISPAAASLEVPIADHLFIVKPERNAFFEAVRPVMQQNKESLATIMELSNELNCSIIHACVKKNMKQQLVSSIIHSFLAIGFSLENPNASMSMPGYIWLAMEL